MSKFLLFSNNKVGGDIITFKYRYRKQILIGIIIFLVVISIASFTTYKVLKDNTKKDKKEENILVEKKDISKKTKVIEEEIRVDIKGEVLSPGIYTVKDNTRVIDVITMAGGLTENADTSVINLSKKVSDEMVIIIYSYQQVENFKETKELELYLEDKCKTSSENGLNNGACISTSEEDVTPTGKVSLNTATKEELMTLTGIGESKAKDIIAYREANGPFENIEDLTKVSGIGESTLEKIRDEITL